MQFNMNDKLIPEERPSRWPETTTKRSQTWYRTKQLLCVI